VVVIVLSLVAMQLLQDLTGSELISLDSALSGFICWELYSPLDAQKMPPVVSCSCKFSRTLLGLKDVMQA
jgi:hypothetical protein